MALMLLKYSNILLNLNIKSRSTSVRDEKYVVIALIVILLALMPISQVSSFPKVSHGSTNGRGAYIIVFKGSKLPKNVDSLISRCGGKILRKLPEIGVVIAVSVGDPALFEEKLKEMEGIEGFGHDLIAELPPNEIIIPFEESELVSEYKLIKKDTILLALSMAHVAHNRSFSGGRLVDHHWKL